MLLILDFGNTQIKAAVFEGTTLLNKYWLSNDNLEIELENIFLTYPQITTIGHVSVTHQSIEALDYLRNRFEVFAIERTGKFPFLNAYATPETLGMDRMVLAAGAVLRYPAQNRLVIDAGTCVTYDYISADDVYRGGAISPGLQMRYEALHHHTAKLPLLKASEHPKLVGNSTENSIHSGVINGIQFELEGFINNYCEEKENIIIILTGGDANFLAGHLKNTIFANPNFLLESIVLLHQYQTND
ncbi:type III pantothenate kinase [Flavobacterium sp. N1719]|uniref:type III pantothenate kinase n=1 Tax=Flavobacterium sp. N1719 TaxID=2885633 RepID=UPI0022217976|nr:type III pantothenate kinase [Flavobacterium sp. N1719]